MHNFFIFGQNRKIQLFPRMTFALLKPCNTKTLLQMLRQDPVSRIHELINLTDF